MKKIVSFLLSAVLIMGQFGTVVFSDDSVMEKWRTAGVILGDGSGNLNENAELCRAELIAIINRMFGMKNDTKPNYNDVSGEEWYYDDVVAAVQNGYLNDTGSFNGDEKVTWLEAVDIVVRATGIAAPLSKKEMAVAARKTDEKSAYAVAVLEKRGICSRNAYNEIITKKELVTLLDGVYTQLFSGTKKAIDFSLSQRKYVNDDFEWDVVGGFPSNWYCQESDYVSVTNKSENNYVSINKNKSDGSAEIIKYFQPLSNKMTFEADIMSEETSGEKIGPDLRTSVYRDNTSVIKMRMNNGAIYTTDGGSSVRLMDFTAGKWYKVKLDIDLDSGEYDVYIDGTLLRAGCSVNTNIYSGHIGQVHFGFETGKSGTMGIDNVSLYSNCRNKEAIEEAAQRGDSVIVDFQDMQPGTIPAGWSYTKQGSSVYVEQSAETPNRYLVMDKPGYESSGYDRFTYTFPKPLSGLVQIEWRAKVGDNSGDWKYFQLENQKLQVVFISDRICLVDSSRSEFTVYEGVAANKWYKLKIVADTTKSTYSFYVNGQKVKDNVTFVAGGDQISNIWMQMASNAKGKLYMDDLTISTLGQVQSEAAKGFEAQPIDGVTKNSDWIAKYQAKPTDNAVQAENMKLNNFNIVENDNAFGGKAISADNIGNATAEYVFEKPSGFYSIKVGYIENTLKKDSLFRVYHNGEEIDFWYGQFDDGLLHVRDVKNKYYINTGDTFVLEGYNGEDPSVFDYIDFGEAIEPNFERGYLVQDEFHAPGNYARSSWTVSEAGGAARILNGSRNFGIMDNSTTENVWAKRPFLPQSGVFTSELDFIYAAPDDGLTMAFRNGETDIVRLVTDGGTVFAENTLGEKREIIGGYVKDKQYQCKIVMDIPNACITIVKANGESVVMPMPETDMIDNFCMYSSKSRKGHLKLKSLDVYAGYVVNETFKALDPDVVPPNWDISGRASVIETNNADQFDTTSLLLYDGSKASYKYDKLKGSSTISFSFLAKGNGSLNMTAGNVSVSLEGGNLYLKAGGSQKIWDNVKLNQYYDILLEQDGETGKLNAYVNNIKKAAVDYKAEHDAVSFTSSGCDVILDSVVVYEGIEKSDVPAPEKVDTGDYIIGMQTCDLWHEGDHFGWDCIRKYDNRTPLAGYYDDNDQEYVDWEIKWWAEHGISLYFPCWYREFRNVPIREAHHNQKIERFKHSQYSDSAKFAVCYENSGRISNDEDFLNSVFTYWIEHYFKHPSYLVIDNKPIIGIWSHGLFLDDCGSPEKVAALFEKAEEMLKQEGFSGAIWLTNYMGSDKAGAQKIVNSGYDYVYYYGSGQPIEQQTKRYEDQQTTGMVNGIVSISQGWGADAWGLSPRKTNLTLDEFTRGIQWARDVYMPKYSNDSLASKMVLFGNWNEIAEGHMYVPSKLSGFGYLDMIRNVFSTDSGEHTDIVPENKYDALYPGLRN